MRSDGPSEEEDMKAGSCAASPPAAHLLEEAAGNRQRLNISAVSQDGDSKATGGETSTGCEEERGLI